MSCTLAVLSLVMSPGSGVYQWGKLPREPIKTVKKYLGFPASVCSSVELQTEQKWLPILFRSYLVFTSSSATTSSLRLSLSTPVYCALSPCELHTVGVDGYLILENLFMYSPLIFPPGREALGERGPWLIHVSHSICHRICSQ